MKIRCLFYLLVISLPISSCASAKSSMNTVQPEAQIEQVTGNSTLSSSPAQENEVVTPLGEAGLPGDNTQVSAPVNELSPELENRLPPEQWQEWPVVPEFSERVREIYLAGQAMGNNPGAFSKVGDCQSIKEVLLGIYDQPDRYVLTEKDAYMQETIDLFAGSFNRDGMAVKGGFNAASVLSPMWSDPAYCQPGEIPLECEFRVHRPSFVLISLEVWWNGRTPERYEAYMRQILDRAIQHGVVPILSTKADNVEGDHSINAVSARLAYEYDIPLWNFWLAVQGLPFQGIDPERDGFHITTEAWNARSFTALQTLDALQRFVTQQQGATHAMPTESPSGESEFSPDIQATMEPLSLQSVSERLYLMETSGKIYFGMARSGASGTEKMGIYLLDLDAQLLTQIFPMGYDLLAANSASQQILFNHRQNLYLGNLIDASVGLITDRFVADYDGLQARWLGDNLKIAYLSQGEITNQVSILNPEDSSLVYLPVLEGKNPVEIYGSFDLNAIYWGSGVCDSSGVCQLDGTWVTNPGSNQTSELIDVIQPLFSSSGGYFAYRVNLPDGKSQIKIANLDRSIDRNLELPGSHVVDYAWSPVQEKLAVLMLERSDYYGKSSSMLVFIIDPANWSIQQMQPFSAMNAQLLWSSDGKNLLTSGTEQIEPEEFRVNLRIMNLETKKMIELGNVLGFTGKEFLLITKGYWQNSQP